MLYLWIALTRIYLIQCYVKGRCLLRYAGRFTLLSLEMGSPSGEGLIASMLAWDVSSTESVSSLTVMGVCGLTNLPNFSMAEVCES